MNEKELSMLVLVKAAPIAAEAYDEESVCLAGMTLSENPEWVRLYPVPFRDLIDETGFSKYQEVTLRAVRPSNDRRPESWKPIAGSIQARRTIGTGDSWSERRRRVGRLGERTMCELNRENEGGSGPGTQSLAVVRLQGQPELLIEYRPDEEIATWQQRAERIANTPSLFDSGGPRAPIEVVPWRFLYRYRCLEPRCKGHRQTIVDWEIAALWRKMRSKQKWRDLLHKKFVDELWSPDRDSVLFVGNQRKNPWGFLVLGVFWPPRTPIQPSLLS